MSPPIYTPDGSEVSEIVLPDGSTASQVIGPDGNVVFEAGGDIPDSVVLDDWADAPTVTSSEITDRQSFDELSYQGPSPNAFSPSNSRPDWDVDNNDVSVDDTNEVLNFNNSSASVLTESTAFDNIRWEIGFDEISGEGRVSIFLAENKNIEYFSTAQLSSNNQGYYLEIAKDNSELSLTEDRSRSEIVASGSYDTSVSNPTFAVERDSVGNWELFANGDSKATATDTTYTDTKNWVGIGVGDNTGAKIQYFVSYPLE